MARVFVAFGSNLGDRVAHFRSAFLVLEQEGLKCVKNSSIYETEPVGHSVQEQDPPWYLNAAALLETSLSPTEILTLFQAIEVREGRSSEHRKSTFHRSRPLDLDLLFYDDKVLSTPLLTLPHPHLHERRFVLQPLAEVASHFKHPVFKKTVQQLLGECHDESECRLFLYKWESRKLK
jgi:2-amino-4-hydroxy-6-hydroxymethyldihydropteridine diphosphokinase